MLKSKLKIIYVEDSSADFAIMKKYIGDRAELKWAKSGEDALKLLESESYDAIMIDLELLNQDGLPQPVQGEELAEKVKERFPTVPIFIVSNYVKRKIPFVGCYPKNDVFSLEGVKTLLGHIESAIYSRKRLASSPVAPGIQWKRKWEAKWLEFKDREGELYERKVSTAAEKDIDLLNSRRITGSYRAYRGSRTVFDVLVARRVLCYAFIEFSRKSKSVWSGMESYLNMDEAGIKNYMFEVGIAWGAILNGKTLLREEAEWIERFRGSKLSA